MAVLRMVGSIDVFSSYFYVGTCITVLIPFGTRKPGESLKITAGTAETRMVIPNRCRFLGVNIAPKRGDRAHQTEAASQ